jgi:PAS domain-containing protein
VQNGLLRALRDRRDHIPAQERDVTGRRKDGSIVPIRRAVGHARLDDKDLFVCFITDISERRAMEQALRASEQQFRSLIGNIPGISYRSQLEGEPRRCLHQRRRRTYHRLSGRDFIGARAAARRSFAP